MAGRTLMVSVHRFRFGPIGVELANRDARLQPQLGRALDLYESLADGEPADLAVHMGLAAAEMDLDRPLQKDHWDFADGLGARLGRFYLQRWQVSDPQPRVLCGMAPSPLHPIRPFVDYEFHTARGDIDKFLHDQVLIPGALLLFAERLTVFHAATFTDPRGQAVMITGRGGVGKTSLGLEVGRRPGWDFVSDDLVVVDDDGTAYLNGAWPKIYAYNVADDPELEATLLKDRSFWDRLHWKGLRRWPKRVRRSVSPRDLYGSVSLRAPLAVVLEVRREDVGTVTHQQIDADLLASTAAEVVAEELGRFGAHVAAHATHRRTQGLSPLPTTWDPALWETRAAAALAAARCWRVSIPRTLDVSAYRRAMTELLPALLAEAE